MGPRAGLDSAENLASPGFDHRTVQPVESYSTHCAIPAHMQIPVHLPKKKTDLDFILFLTSCFRFFKINFPVCIGFLYKFSVLRIPNGRRLPAL